MDIRTQDAEDFSASKFDPFLSGTIRKSDTEAFKFFYFRSYNLLFWYIWNISHPHECAEDTRQELFTCLCRNHRSQDRINTLIKTDRVCRQPLCEGRII